VRQPRQASNAELYRRNRLEVCLGRRCVHKRNRPGRQSREAPVVDRSRRLCKSCLDVMMQDWERVGNSGHGFQEAILCAQACSKGLDFSAFRHRCGQDGVRTKEAVSVGWKRYKALGKNLSSGGHKVTLHDFWQQQVPIKQARPSQVRRRQCREPTKGQTPMDPRFPEVVLCRFCGSVGHAAHEKCKYCEIGRVDQLERLPQGVAWRDALQQAGISSASQLRKQVARGRCVPCRGCGAFRVKDAKQQCMVCGIRPLKRMGAARMRFVVGSESTSRWRCNACSSEGRRHGGSCKHFRTCGGKYTVPTIQGSFLSTSDEGDIRHQRAQVASLDGASRRRMIEDPPSWRWRRGGIFMKTAWATR